MEWSQCDKLNYCASVQDRSQKLNWIYLPLQTLHVPCQYMSIRSSCDTKRMPADFKKPDYYRFCTAWIWKAIFVFTLFKNDDSIKYRCTQRAIIAASILKRSVFE